MDHADEWRMPYVVITGLSFLSIDPAKILLASSHTRFKLQSKTGFNDSHAWTCTNTLTTKAKLSTLTFTQKTLTVRWVETYEYSHYKELTHASLHLQTSQCAKWYAYTSLINSVFTVRLAQQNSGNWFHRKRLKHSYVLFMHTLLKWKINGQRRAVWDVDANNELVKWHL